LDAYAVREQEIQARAAVISTNGFRVDVQVAQARVDKLAARRQVILEGLQADYGLPTEGKAPWATNAGKAAIMAALADYQITPKTRKDWTLTATGNYSLGGETLIGLTKGTPAEELGIALAELKGQRTLAQLALDSVQPDGMVHPEISMLQRSGRWSTTEPGLTVWTARGPGAVEKEYFIPDSEDHALVGFDYSNADARAVAAYSGDRGYAERFKPGKDGHMINAVVAWGQSVVDTDPEGYRQKAKVPGHGWGYLIGPKKLARSTGMPVQEAKQFLGNMNDAYAGVVRWQRQCTYYASQHGYVVNDWGRRMWVERGREYTQAPALIGQSATREIICDALLAMPISVLRMVKAQIHDELILSIPKEGLEVTRKQVIELMQTSFSPKGGQTIDFPVDSGSPGKNWYEASH
jgi:DNA polymerase-1